jgi:hypothetical protein
VAGTVNTTPEGIADLESRLEQLRLIANNLLVLCFSDFPIRQPNERDKLNKPNIGQAHVWTFYPNRLA